LDINVIALICLYQLSNWVYEFRLSLVFLLNRRITQD